MTSGDIIRSGFQRVRDELDNPATVDLLDSLETVTLEALATLDDITATIRNQPTIVALDNVVHIGNWRKF